MRTPRAQIKIFEEQNETINGYLVAKMYDLSLHDLKKQLLETIQKIEF